MLRQIAVVFFHGIALIACLLGIFLLLRAVLIPNQYLYYEEVEIYLEGIYSASAGIGAMLVAIFIEVMILASAPKQTGDLQAVQEDVAEVKRLSGITANMVNTVRKNTQKSGL